MRWSSSDRVSSLARRIDLSLSLLSVFLSKREASLLLFFSNWSQMAIWKRRGVRMLACPNSYAGQTDIVAAIAISSICMRAILWKLKDWFFFLFISLFLFFRPFLLFCFEFPTWMTDGFHLPVFFFLSLFLSFQRPYPHHLDTPPLVYHLPCYYCLSFFL